MLYTLLLTIIGIQLSVCYYLIRSNRRLSIEKDRKAENERINKMWRRLMTWDNEPRKGVMINQND